MSTKRQERFLAQVAEAARKQRPKSRGRPNPQNLTEEGRQRGLAAIAAAPRCKATRRNGQPCRAAALRGATKCLKHGGRVQVPDHPHNIRRYFEGRITVKSPSVQTDQQFWDSLSRADRAEVLEVVPEHVIKSSHRLYAAAREWMQIRDKGYPALRRFRLKYSRPVRARDDDWE